MKKIILISIFFFSVFFTYNLFAIESRKDYFLKPQFGIWFGPITPIYTTREEVDTNLGGGIYFRYNTPWNSLKIGLDASYQKFTSQSDNRLYLLPVYGNFIYLLPIKLPIRFQLKAGAGSCYIHMKPDDVKQWEPVFMTGWEFSFPAGRIVNIGLRIEYLYIYEQYINRATKNGHVINSGLTLYFNL